MKKSFSHFYLNFYLKFPKKLNFVYFQSIVHIKLVDKNCKFKALKLVGKFFTVNKKFRGKMQKS